MTFEELLERELWQEDAELSQQKLRNSLPAADKNSITENYLEQRQRIHRNLRKRQLLEAYKKASAQCEEDISKQVAKGVEDALLKYFK